MMFQSNVKLSQHSNYKIGGPASYFFEAKNADEVIAAVEKWRAEAKGIAKKNIFVLGGGTNLLISDKGYRGLVLKPAITTLALESGANVRVGSGVLMSNLLDFAAKQGLSGLEWAGGLPGTVGGAIRGNAGAFGGEAKDSIAEVTSIYISGKIPKLMRRNNAECKFGYRDSVFKQCDGKEVIIEAIFALKKGESAVIARAVAEKINYRKTRHPMEYPNVGSIFKNVDFKQFTKAQQKNLAHIVKADPFPVVPTAYLINEAGLKGVSYGGALISPKHPNFIVNAQSASSDDVKKLIKLVKTQVKKKFGVKLEEEIIYV